MTGYEEGRGIDTRGNEVEGMLGVNERGETYYIDDPRADRISRRLRMNLSRDESEPILDEILADEGMFRCNLLEMPGLAGTIKGYYHRIKERGLDSALRELLNRIPEKVSP
jgi:mannitol-1-phosphate/altronate dehydrogenase